MGRETEKRVLNRFPRMMQEYLVRKLREKYRANHARLMGLKTKAEAEAYVSEVREKIEQVYGPWPERTPLNIRITGETDREDYVFRNIVFESRPDVPVTANLYLPRGSAGPRPAVLCLCGHTVNGKTGYDTFPQALARMGYVTLIFDPLGQGERIQYPDDEGKSPFGPVREHNIMDRQMVPTGDWIGNWFVWDGMRALDVLLEQEGVDSTRVGVTGNSGGGTQTAYVTACDERITMSAPSCWVCSWYHNAALNEEPVDAEQCPPGILAAGLEHSDLLISRAPNPVIVLTQEQDFFDQRGALEAFERIKHVYKLLGAEEKAVYHVGPGDHGYHLDAREAMYAFFNRHAEVDVPGKEPDLVKEDVATVECTPGGAANDLEGARSVPSLTCERSQDLAKGRGTPAGDDLDQHIRGLLDLPNRKGPPDYRILRPWDDRGYARPHSNQFVLETDPEFGAQVVVTKLEDEYRTARPQRGDGPAMLYLPHISSDQELRENEEIRQLETENPAFFACDYRGIGESRPDTCRPDSFFSLYGSDYHYASCASMLGDSYVSWRVHDILCTLDWMASFGYDRVHLVGQGWGTIPGALVGLLDERVKRVTLIHAPKSYTELAEAPMQEWPLSCMLPGVLERFDLPDVYRKLARKDLRMIEPWGPLMKSTGPES
ncbi:MAG: acetylxylan esterase [Candidatus Brocadiia bacterium]